MEVAVPGPGWWSKQIIKSLKSNSRFEVLYGVDGPPPSATFIAQYHLNLETDLAAVLRNRVVEGSEHPPVRGDRSLVAAPRSGIFSVSVRDTCNAERSVARRSLLPEHAYTILSAQFDVRCLRNSTCRRELDMAAPLAFNHVGITVPDIDRAINWYRSVMGFRLIFRRLMQYQPQVPEVREIFGPRFARAHQAHLLSANGVGIELFQFLDPPVVAQDDNFQYWRTGIFHLCITDPNLDKLVARIVAEGGRQRTKIWTFLPGRPYQLVYCEDPFGNIIEAFSHSYAETFSNMSEWYPVETP